MFTTMQHIATWSRSRFGADDRGASLVEYALLLALIAMVCIAAVTFIGQKTSEEIDSVGTILD